MKFQSKLPAHSQAALQAIIQLAKKEGLPELSSSNDQRAARVQLVESAHGGHLGPLIQEATLAQADGGTMTLPYVNFLVYISKLYSQGGSFTQLLQAKHAQNPSSPDKPWGLTLYTDEVIPGNVLGRAERKAWTIYATLDEFRPQLHHTDLWLTLAIARTSHVQKLDAGIGQLMAVILQSIFCHPYAEPQGGFPLTHETGTIRLYFTWKTMVCDGAAHKQVWATKGDSGAKFCLLCGNVRGHRARQTEEPDEAEPEWHWQPTPYDQLHLVSDEDILASYARLHARKATTSAADFSRWQVATGLTYSHHALLLNEPLKAKAILKPVQQFAHDWMHAVLQGTAPIVLHHTLKAIAPHMKVYEFMEQYLSHFQLPQQDNCAHLAALFSSKNEEKHKASQKFGAMASEILAIYPIVRHFLHTVVPVNIATEEIAAFMAQAALIDQLHGGIMYQRTTRTTLLEAVQLACHTFGQAFQVPFIKKWHWLLHLPDELQRFGHLPNCFACERKHKSISQFATKLQKTKDFELHLLTQVVAQEITKLEEPDLFPCHVVLLKPRHAKRAELQALNQFVSESLPAAMVSSCARLSTGAQCHCTDLVVFSMEGQWQLGHVQFHVQFQELFATLVQLWDVAETRFDQQHAICNVTEQMGLIHTETILFPLVYQMRANQKAHVLLPYQMYSGQP